jgi:hypothetical protein
VTEETREKSDAHDLRSTSSVVVSMPQVAPADSPAIAAPAGQTGRAPRTPAPGNSNLMPRLRNAIIQWAPEAQYQLTRLGSVGIAGVGATAAAVVIGAIALLSLRTANESLSAQILRAQHRPAAAVTPEQGLTRAVAQLPTRSQMPAVLGQVLQQARAARVELAKGQYTYVAPSAGGFGRYELDFPVKAPYPGVRDFINRTLTHIPAAGLDKLSIERKVVGDTLVNADVRFFVFVRSEPEK